MADETITSIVEINKVQTLADNGFRWTLDAPETAVMQSAALMAMKQAGVAIEVTFKMVKTKQNEYGGRLKE